jgi:hypothetical protein
MFGIVTFSLFVSRTVRWTACLSVSCAGKSWSGTLVGLRWRLRILRQRSPFASVVGSATCAGSPIPDFDRGTRKGIDKTYD